MYQSDSAPWLEFYAWNTDGTAKTDLVYNTSGISIVVVRDNLANSSALTLSAASGPTDWAAGKFWAMGGNKYRVGIATASISSFTGQISVEGSYTGGVLTGVTREVSAYNPAYEPLRPATAGRTITVSAAGAVELDSASVTAVQTGLSLEATSQSIKAKTDNLPSDPADQSAVEAAITAATSPLATPAQVNAQVVDALSVDTYAELTAPPAATSSLKDKITWLFMYARNKVTQTATQRKLYRDDGSTVAGTSATDDTAGTFTKGEDA